MNLCIKKGLGALLIGAFSMSIPAAVQAASNWYFHVENNSNSRIVTLQVSENKKKWGDFDIGRGIAAGKAVKIVWDSSTDDDDCKQWIRASFADGSTSEPARFDFCKDLDEPIVFE